MDKAGCRDWGMTGAWPGAGQEHDRCMARCMEQDRCMARSRTGAWQVHDQVDQVHSQVHGRCMARSRIGAWQVHDRSMSRSKPGAWPGACSHPGKQLLECSSAGKTHHWREEGAVTAVPGVG